MKQFKTKQDAIEYANFNLGKTETESIYIGNEKVLACGTPMVEDIIDNAIAEMIARVTRNLTGTPIDASAIYIDNDRINSIKELVWEQVLDLSGNKDYIFGSEEY